MSNTKERKKKEETAGITSSCEQDGQFWTCVHFWSPERDVCLECFHAFCEKGCKKSIAVKTQSNVQFSCRVQQVQELSVQTTFRGVYPTNHAGVSFLQHT